MRGRRVAFVAGAATLVVGGVVAFVATRGTEPTGRVAQASSGDLMDRVRHLVAAMPKPGSSGYDEPTAGERSAMAAAARSVRSGELSEAAALAAPLDYTVSRYTDTGTGRTLVALAERPRSDGTYAHGWGLFLYDPGSRSPLRVDVAHPFDDLESWIVGVETFRMAHGASLLVAGASRFGGEGDAADVAHTENTVFEAVHRAWLTKGAVVFEPHGFDTTEHVDYGDVVVSSGTFPPDPVAKSVAAALRKAGLNVCLYDGEQCSQLGGTTNVQGTSTREARDSFLHIEMSSAVRKTESSRRAVAEAVTRAVAGGAG